MIASVLTLNRRAVNALHITDPYSLHRVVYDLFEDTRTDAQKAAGHPSGILFADMGVARRGRRVILLSNRRPLPQGEERFGEVQSKEVSPEFLTPDRYRFVVDVNPVRRIAATGKLAPVTGEEAIRAWFCERAEGSWGFSTPAKSPRVCGVEVLEFYGKNANPITISKARLEGIIEVADRAKFQAAFSRGIGRAKAFGCGLLQIVPLLENPFFGDE